MANLTLTTAGANVATGANIAGGLTATAGDDTITISAPGYLIGSTLADALGGIDTLAFTGPGTYDLSGLTLTGIERLDLSVTAGGYTVTLTVAQIGALTAIVGGNPGTARSQVDDHIALIGGGTFDLTGASITNVYIHLDSVATSITGTSGNDQIIDGAGDDTIYGGDGDDYLQIEAGSNVVYGGAGADTLSHQYAGPTLGTCTLDGGEGNDDIRVRGGSHVLDGGEGTDTLTYAYHTTAVHIDAAAGRVTDADGKNDTISGFEVYTGTAYADTIIGTAGADTIRGGAGADTLTGGAGADVFRYAAADTGVDTITDFGTGDTIQLLHAGANLTGAVTVGDGTSVAAGAVQLQYDHGDTLLYVDTNGLSGAADLTIRLTGTYGADRFTAGGKFIAYTPAPPPPPPAPDPGPAPLPDPLTGWAPSLIRPMQLDSTGQASAAPGTVTVQAGIGRAAVFVGGGADISAGALDTTTRTPDPWYQRSVTLNGQAVQLVGVDTVVSRGTDIVRLDDAGGRLTVSGVDLLIGGAGADVVTFESRPNCDDVTYARGIETLIGGAGFDHVALSAGDAAVSLGGNWEAVTAADGQVINLLAGATLTHFAADTKAAVIALDQTRPEGNDVLVFSSTDTASALTVTGFHPMKVWWQLNEVGEATRVDLLGDRITFSGDLAARIDHNGDCLLAIAERAAGEITAADELVRFEPPVTLDDGATLAQAMGEVGRGAAFVAVASNGQDTGLYAAWDADLNGRIGAEEVHHLATLVGTSDLSLTRPGFDIGVLPLSLTSAAIASP